MTASSSIPWHGIVVVIGVLCVLALLVARRRRRRRAAARAVVYDDPDYELIFPEGPEERIASRRTLVGRQISRRG